MKTVKSHSKNGGAMIWVMAALALGVGLYIIFGVMKLHKFRAKIDEAMGKKPVTEVSKDEGVLGMHQENLRLQDEARQKAMSDMAKLQSKAHQMAKETQRAAIEAEMGEVLPGQVRAPVEMPVIPLDPQSAQQMAMEMAAKAHQKQVEVERRVRELESEGQVSVPPPVEARNAVPGLPENKPDNELTPEEAKIKAEIEKELMALLPTHRIVFDRNIIMTGRVLREDADSVTFAEMSSGATMSVTVKRSRINDLRPVSGSAPPVTYRDIRFKMEYPALAVLKTSPYTMLNSAKVGTGKSVMKMLANLHSGFVERFKGVIPAEAAARKSIQILLLTSETEFEQCRQKYEGWGRTTGAAFYSEKEDRLVILDPEIAGRNRRYTSAIPVQTAVRREGAIQLCFALGVLLPAGAPKWLVDGIGVYCEEERLGQYNNSRSKYVKDRISSASTFVNYARGHADADFCRTIIHFLMQEQMKNKFFEYVKELRSGSRGRASGQADEISRAAGLSGEQLEQRWQAYVSTL